MPSNPRDLVGHDMPTSLPTMRSSQRGPQRPSLLSDRGFSIIEVLVSALMVILIASATARALISSSHFTADERLRSQADSVAAQDQERLRGLSDLQLTQLESTPQSRTVTLGGTTFTIASSDTSMGTTGNTGCSSTAAAYYKIVSTISWPEAFTKRAPTLTTQSVLARPVSGDLPVVVNDQTGAPLSAVGIQATGPSNQSGSTDSNGCVLFAGLNPGSYTVTATDSGYVDPKGNVSPVTATTTVASTGTAAQNFRLGLAGSVVGTFAAQGASGSVSGEADGLSWTGTGSSLPTWTSMQSATAGTSITTPALFPFYQSTAPVGYANNYTLWAGQCAGQQPPTNQTQATVTPGSVNQSATILEPLLNLGNVTYSVSTTRRGVTTTTNTPERPNDVKLTWTDGTCTDTWSVPVLSGSASAVPATGWLQYPGQPYAAAGTLTVCADYNPSGSTYYHGSTTTGNTSFAASNTANQVPTITVPNSSSGKC